MFGVSVLIRVYPRSPRGIRLAGFDGNRYLCRASASPDFMVHERTRVMAIHNCECDVEKVPGPGHMGALLLSGY